MVEAAEAEPKPTSGVRFVFSSPYERNLLKLKREQLTPEAYQAGRELAVNAQRVWDKHEARVFGLFAESLRIDTSNDLVECFVSHAAPNPFSHPMTMTFGKISRLHRKRDA